MRNLAHDRTLSHHARMANGKALHVVFGAGQIGVPLALELVRRGHEVRVVRRSPGHAPAGATLRTQDAGDPTFVAQATQGAAAIYHRMNPSYSASQWSQELPCLPSPRPTPAPHD